MDKKLKTITISVITVVALLIVLALIIKPETNSENGFIEDSNSEEGQAAAAPLTSVSSKPTYKVFFENTGSMNGYVRENSRLKDVLHDLLANIENPNLTDNELNLNFVNNVIIPRDSDISNFRNELNPSIFRELCQQFPGCNLGDTYFPDIFETTLNDISKNDVGIWISDCIPSTGDDVSTREELNQQSIELRRIFSKKLMEYKFNTLVLHLNSNYNGQYWDKNEDITYIENIDRPYYIWIFGKEDYIKELKSVIEQTRLLQQDLLNYHYFFFYDSEKLDYRISPHPRTGNFTLEPQSPQNTIKNAQAETLGQLSGEFQFPVYVDFSEFPMSESYYTNPANYDISPHYSIEIETTDSEEHTHIIKLTTENLQSETLELRLKNQLSEWIYDYHLYADTDILSDEQIDKTFGLKYLFKGTHDAYLAQQEYREHFFNLTININK